MAETDSSQKKDDKPWQFKKGVVQNPGGRPKEDPMLRAKLRDIQPEVLDFWISTMRDKKAKGADSLRASENLRFAYYGKFRESVDLNANITDVQNVDLTTMAPEQVTALLDAVAMVYGAGEEKPETDSE